jgi:hypothetical protein
MSNPVSSTNIVVRGDGGSGKSPFVRRQHWKRYVASTPGDENTLLTKYEELSTCNVDKITYTEGTDFNAPAPGNNSNTDFIHHFIYEHSGDGDIRDFSVVNPDMAVLPYVLTPEGQRVVDLVALGKVQECASLAFGCPKASLTHVKNYPELTE